MTVSANVSKGRELGKMRKRDVGGDSEKKEKVFPENGEKKGKHRLRERSGAWAPRGSQPKAKKTKNQIISHKHEITKIPCTNINP